MAAVRRLTLSEKIARVEAYHRHDTVAAAARAVGLAPRVLHLWLAKNGILTPGQTQRPWTTSELALLKQRLREGRSGPEIARELGRGDGVVRVYAGRLGIDVRTRHRWTSAQRRMVADVLAASVRTVCQRLDVAESVATTALIAAAMQANKRRKRAAIVDLGGMVTHAARPRGKAA